tara:strand:+ start:958 stop:1257 length:300 start_codon:yes stop_codon:yes gene_type:complete
LLIKQEKFVLKILLVPLTDGILAMDHNNTLLKTGPIPKEIQQTAVFQTVKNSHLLEYSDVPMTLNTNARIEKSKESSHILVNINVAGKVNWSNYHQLCR